MAVVTLFYRCRNCGVDFPELVTCADTKTAGMLLRQKLDQLGQGAVDHECGLGCDNLIGVADLVAACDGEVSDA